MFVDIPILSKLF